MKVTLDVTERPMDYRSEEQRQFDQLLYAYNVGQLQHALRILMGANRGLLGRVHISESQRQVIAWAITSAIAMLGGETKP